MEDFIVFIYIIGLIWAVLNLILFFKIWSMTNDVKELKEYIVAYSTKNKTLSQQGIKEELDVKNSQELKEQRPDIIVNWAHKFQVGDMVRYKSNGNTLYIAQVLETKNEYKCKDANGNMLTAIFLEKELY